MQQIFFRSSEDAECELNCKPIGMKYFATLNKTVVDGTSCNTPSEYFRRRDNAKAICVEGICKVRIFFCIFLKFEPERLTHFNLSLVKSLGLGLI